MMCLFYSILFYSSVGYSNEVGESFRALVPVSLVWASYALATAYVSADAVDKGKKAAVVSSQFFVWQFMYCHTDSKKKKKNLLKYVCI